MIRHLKGFTQVVLCVAAAVAATAGPARAQTPGPAPASVVIVDNTHFEPLFDKVTLAHDAKLDRDLDVGGFARISILAAADSAPNTGKVVSRTMFGPPDIPVPSRLILSFAGGMNAHHSATLPVEGPHLTIGVENQSAQSVDLSLSVYAVK